MNASVGWSFTDGKLFKKVAAIFGSSHKKWKFMKIIIFVLNNSHGNGSILTDWMLGGGQLENSGNNVFFFVGAWT